MTTKTIDPITPGEVLKEEFLAPLGVSQNALARAIGVSPRRVNEIVLGNAALLLIPPYVSLVFSR